MDAADWPLPTIATTEPPRMAGGLEHRATLLWPQSPYLQAEWLRAVGVLRQGRRGWVMDQPLKRARQ